MSVAATSFIAALAQEGSIKSYLEHGGLGHLFRSEPDQNLFKFFDEHVRTYAKLPAPETILHHAKVELPTPSEPAAYYLELMRKAYVEVSIYDAAKAADAKLKAETKDPIGALDILRERVSRIDAHQMQPYVSDYREAGETLVNAYKSTLMGDNDTGLKFGWPTLDKMSGGLVEGDVVSFAGRPAAGKSFFMLWCALAMWRQGRAPLFVSMEMSPLSILQRLSAIHAQKAIGDIKNGTLTSQAYEGYRSVLASLKGFDVPFWVVDGNLKATAHDIHALALQLKPGAIFVDGAYLMKHPSEKERYRRVAENMDLIKTDLAGLAPTVCSWQFNREAKKLKQGQNPDLEHIGYSDAIGQHSSLVLGLFEDESVESKEQKQIHVLKGRNGEIGTFSVNWRFSHTTDFSEVSNDIEDLGY